MYRSMLYVPASSERFVAGAATCGADAIILDLEDGVAPSEKAGARARLTASVATCASKGSDVWVRINRPLGLAVADMAASVNAGAKGVLITKVEGAQHVRLLLEAAGEANRERAHANPLKAIAMIESPGVIAHAGEIARAHCDVFGLLCGGEDIAKEMGAVSGAETLRLPKLLIHLAAKGAGIYSFGTPGSVAGYKDLNTIEQLASEARRHGFDGATCIHPSVVPVLNAAFSSTDAEVDEARAMILEATLAYEQGRGAFSFRGRMVDEPVVEGARRLVARAALHPRKNT